MSDATLQALTQVAPAGLASPTPLAGPGLAPTTPLAPSQSPNPALSPRPRRRRSLRFGPQRGLRFAVLKTNDGRRYLLAISSRNKRDFTVRSAFGSKYRLGRRSEERFETLKRAQTRFERLLRTQLKGGYRECLPAEAVRALLNQWGFSPVQVDPAFAPYAARFSPRPKRYQPRSARALIDRGWRAYGAPEPLHSDGEPIFLSIDATGRTTLYYESGIPASNPYLSLGLGERAVAAGYAPLVAEITSIYPKFGYQWRPMFADLAVLRGQSLSDFDAGTRELLLDELLVALNAGTPPDGKTPTAYRALPISTPTPKRLRNARLVSPTGEVAWVEDPR